MADPFSLLTVLPAPVPVEVAERLLLEMFDIEGSASPLPGERDLNFKIEASGGRRYVFKIHHPEEDPAVVDLQDRALIRLAARAPELPVPRLAMSVTGSCAPRGPDGRILRLLSWVEGQPLSERRPLGRELLGSLGAVLGRMDEALEGLEAPAGLPPLMWDLQRLGGLRGLLAHIPDAPVEARARRALDVLDEAGFPEGLPRQVIHNDANPFNVLAQGERVSGLLDFGDLVLGSRVQELAVAASYHLEPDTMAAMVALCRAYHAVFPLTGAELRLLPALVAGRCAQTVMIGSWRRSQLPPHIQYVLKNYNTAAAGLEALETLGPGAGEALAEVVE